MASGTGLIDKNNGRALDPEYAQRPSGAWADASSGGADWGIRGIDLLGGANAVIAPFTTSYLEYDAQDRVIRHDVQAADCSSCTDGIGTFAYAYATNPAAPTDKSAWHTKTTETRPDGTERTVFTAGHTGATPPSPNSSRARGLLWKS